MLRIAALLLVAVVVIEAEYTPRAILRKDVKFDSKIGRVNAFDHCKQIFNQRVAHIDQLLKDHKEQRAKHFECGWTYDREGPYRVTCDDSDKDHNGFCKNPKEKLCKEQITSVFCNTKDLPEEWEYDEGELVQAVMFEGQGVVHHVGAAKALCVERGMTLAYSSQVAAQSTRYGFSTQCQHCFVRKNHAVYSANCQFDLEFDYWVQDTDETYCYVCYGVPKLMKTFEHPCKHPFPSYGGHPIECVKDEHGKKTGDIIIQNRVDCSLELDGEDGTERFTGKEFHNFKNGFKTRTEKNEPLRSYWLGLQLQHVMTHNINFGLRIDLTGRDGKKDFIEYESVSIGPENKDDHQTRRQYVMTVGPRTEGRGHLTDQLHINQKSNLHTISGSPFSCPPRDNDASFPSSVDKGVDCSALLHSCWYFDLCDTASNLNGVCEGEDTHDAPKKICRIWGKDPNFINFRESTMSLIYHHVPNITLSEWRFDLESDE